MFSPERADAGFMGRRRRLRPFMGCGDRRPIAQNRVFEGRVHFGFSIFAGWRIVCSSNKRRNQPALGRSNGRETSPSGSCLVACRRVYFSAIFRMVKPFSPMAPASFTSWIRRRARNADRL